MRTERVIDLLARGAVAVVLVSLVVAALTLPVNSVRAAPADMMAVSERVAPAARHLIREPEMDVAIVASADTAPIDDMLVAPVIADVPETVVTVIEPEPEPVTEPAPVAQAVPVIHSDPVITDETRAAEVEMLRLMNVSRVAGGLVPLTMDASVSETARSHSGVESHWGYVYHDGPDGTAHARDATACASGWYGENTGKVWNDNVRALHVEFMNEPWEPINHRTNIMDPAFRRVGIGAVQGRDAMYLTMVFCR